MFFFIEKKICNCCLIVWYIRIETQKIASLLNDTDNEPSKVVARKWNVTNDQNNGEYVEGSENDSSIKFESKVIKKSLCDYSDTFCL